MDFIIKKKKYEKNSSNILTKYEKTKLIAERAEQIANGAPSKIPINPNERFDPKKYAKLELKEKVIPLLLVREPIFNNEKKEIFNPNEMEIKN